MERKRVLQISTTPLQYDGLTKVIFSLIENSDKEKYEVDVLAARGGKDVFFNRLDSMGIRVITGVNRAKGIPGYIKSLLALFNEEHYDVVHIHGNSATMAIELYAAKKAGIPIRISHGHNTRTNHPVVHALLKPFLKSFGTAPCACGKMAGEFLYGKSRDFVIIPNAIDTNVYLFNDETRKKTRENLGIKDELLIGHIGRFSFQKNHEFLIEIFEKVLEKSSEAKLLMVGEGELFNEVRSKVNAHNLSDSVIFYGATDKIPPLFMAFDVFILPSRFEGLSLTAVEAQAAGLSVVTSDATTKETDISGKCIFLSLNDSAEIWAEKILENIAAPGGRKSATEAVKAGGYDIKDLPEKIDKIWGQGL